jgi:myosin-15
MVGGPVLCAQLRSNNSSRFGKYVEVLINDGDVIGSVITSYVLEKTRVVAQSKV